MDTNTLLIILAVAALAGYLLKRRARLNCLAHLLSLIPYKAVPRPKVTLPKRSKKRAYDDQAALAGRRFVPETY